jgi:endonuclease/exonuclease/phosphatase family metal-dependent hydrolase
LPDGKSLRIFGWHLKATGSSNPASDYTQRLYQAKSLAKYLRDTHNLNSTGDRIVVCGDMNTTTDAGGNSDFATGSTLYHLTLADDCYESNNLIPVNYRYKHDQFTHPGSGGWPSVTFDYIMLSPAAMQHYVTDSVLVINSPVVSDHYPVIMTMNVP